MKTTLLFDLDGTLTDPRAGIIGSVQYALQRYETLHGDKRINFADDELLWCIGPPLQESFAKLLQTDDRQTIAQAVAFYRKYFGTKGLLQNEVYDGIPELLQTLVEDGYELFVATSKPHVYATQIVAHFGLDRFFSRVYGSELDGIRSNKGDLIHYLLESEGLDPAATVMIGDREHDILGARHCGLNSIGVSWGFGVGDELAQSGATYLVDQPSEIADVLLGRFSAR